MRENIEIKVFEDDYFEFTGSLEGFRAHLNKAFALIPTEFIDSAMVDVDGTDNYGAWGVCMKVIYIRPETDLEMSIREAKEVQDEEHTKAMQLIEFNKLKKVLGL